MQNKKPREHIPLILTFFLPLLIQLGLLWLYAFFSEDPITILQSDKYHQYYPFFLDFRRAILSGESLQWSWTTGMGADYLGQIAYYTASPLYLLSVFIPDAMLYPFFWLLTPLKLSLASLFMGILLRKIHGNSLWLPFFGCAYAFCGWSLGYQWNIIWLDSFALLPLITLGTICLLRDQKYATYTIALAIALISNYYIGIFLCGFVFLLFWCYQFCRWQSWKKFRKDFLRIAVFSLIAICLSAFLLLPAYKSLQSTDSSGEKYHSETVITQTLLTDTEQKELENLWEPVTLAKANSIPAYLSALSKATAASIPFYLRATATVLDRIFYKSTVENIEGPPNVYTGSFIAFLACLALFFQKGNRRERLCGILLLTILLLGMIDAKLNWITHGLHQPKQIPYRYSFIFSFVLILTAYPMWLQRKTLTIGKIEAAYCLCGVFLLFSNLTQGNDSRFVANLILLGLLAVSMILTAHPTPRYIRAKNNTRTPGAFQAHTEPGIPESEKGIASVAADTGVQKEHPGTNILLLDNESIASFFEAQANPGIPSAQYEKIPKQQKSSLVRYWKRFVQALAILLTLAAIITEIVVMPFCATASLVKPNGSNEALSISGEICDLLSHRADDGTLYRTELTPMRTVNDGAFYGFNAVSTFSSSVNAKNTNFILSLGADCSVPCNRAYFGNGSPVSNLFLNLRYIVSTNHATAYNPLFEIVACNGDMELRENRAYLPVGFMVEDGITELVFSEDNRASFDFQNRLFSAATGIKEPVWTKIDATTWEYSAPDGITIIPKETPGEVFAKSQNKAGTLSCTYTAEGTGILTLHISSLATTKEYTLYRNDELLFTDCIAEQQQMVTVGSVRQGDRIRIDLPCPEQNEEDGQIQLSRITGAILNEELFWSGYEKLNASALNVTKYSSTEVTGTIQSEGGLMYTSIPQDGNWVIHVDDEMVTPELIGKTMLGVRLQAGEHTVSFQYKNDTFVLGCVISVLALLAFAGICYTDIRLKETEEESKKFEQTSTVPENL